MTNPYETPAESGSADETRVSIHRARLSVAVGCVLLLPFLWMSVSVEMGNPTWWKPFPMIAVIVTLLLKSELAALFFGSMVVLPAFVLFNTPLLNGKATVSKWSAIFVFLHGVNGLYLLASFSTGVNHLGFAQTVSTCCVTLVLFLGFVILGLWSFRRPNLFLAITSQWLAWVWFVGYSFPLLGPIYNLV